jgi:hypothetical protein
LQASIKYSQRAVDYAGHIGPRTNLANGLLESYFLTNNVDDLERALMLVNQDVQAVSPGDSEISIVMINASSIFLAAYNQWKIVDYLDKAYRCAKSAVDNPPGRRAAYPYILLDFAKMAEVRHN